MVQEGAPVQLYPAHVLVINPNMHVGRFEGVFPGVDHEAKLPPLTPRLAFHVPRQGNTRQDSSVDKAYHSTTHTWKSDGISNNAHCPSSIQPGDVPAGSCRPVQAQSPNWAAAVAAAAAAQLGLAEPAISGGGAHIVTVTTMEVDLSKYPIPQTHTSCGRCRALQSIPRRFPITGTLFVIGRKGRFKAFFGLNGDLVLLVARPDCDSTAVFTTWTFLKSIIDPMVDRLDAKHRDLCRFLIGRGFVGCEYLPYPRRISWGAQP